MMHSDKLRRFLVDAYAAASHSKDRSTKVGAIALGPDWEYRTGGWNGFPRGCNDELEERHVRPAKYAWTEHSERNLIYNAARVGIPLRGCTLLCTHPPCIDCARGIVQAGFVRVAFPAPNADFLTRWEEDMKFSLDLFDEVGIEVIVL